MPRILVSEPESKSAWRLIPRWIGMAFIRLYQLLISPLLHAISGPAAGCRFTPTCSEYALQAVRAFGLVRGSWMALRRILRCHPWQPGGHDPVPPSDRRG